MKVNTPLTTSIASTEKPTATSTSTTAPGGDRPLPIRPRPQGLMARVVPEPCGIPLVDGRTVTARAGDYRIYHGKDTLDVISPARFAVEFEVIDPLALQLTVADCNKLDEILGIAATKDGASLVRACDRSEERRVGKECRSRW